MKTDNTPLRSAGAIALAAVALLLSACGGGDNLEPTGTKWPVADELLDPTGASADDGDTYVTLGDGSTIDVGEPIDTFVVAGDGVYYIADLGIDGPDSLSDLRYKPADGGDVIDTGLDVDSSSMATSDNGRYLGFIEGAQPPARTVIVDLTTGEEVVNSDRGLTTGFDVEPGDVFADVGPEVLKIGENTAWVQTLDGVARFDLETGEGENTGRHRNDFD